MKKYHTQPLNWKWTRPFDEAEQNTFGINGLNGVVFVDTVPLYGCSYLLPFLSIGPVHFRFIGYWVVFFIFVHILIEHSISKQWRP